MKKQPEQTTPVYTVNADTRLSMRAAQGTFEGEVKAGPHSPSDELPEWVLVHIVEQQDRAAREAAPVEQAAEIAPAAETTTEQEA